MRKRIILFLLATQIATNVAKEQKTKIAVLPFRELDGQPTILGTYISEELVTDLFTIGGLEIVERSMLDRIIGELKLSQTGLIDPDTAKKVGKIAGVDAVVTGSITDLQSYVALNCRLINTQTGRIFGAAQTKIVKDDDVRKIMGAQVSAQATTGSNDRRQGTGLPGGSGGQAQQVPKSIQQQQHDGFIFDLKSCTLSGNSVTCDLLVTNTREDRNLGLQIYNSSVNSRLVSEDGGEYRATEVALGMYKGENIESSLVSGVPVRAKVMFTVSPEIQRAALVDIVGYWQKELRIQFRNVTLVRP